MTEQRADGTDGAEGTGGSGGTEASSGSEGTGATQTTDTEGASGAGRHAAPDHSGGGSPADAATVRHAPSSEASTQAVGQDAPTRAVGGVHDAPTRVQPVPQQQAPRQQPPARSGPGVLGRGIRKVTNLLAVLAKLVAFVFAAVLVLRIVLAFVGVNGQNVVAQWTGTLADRVVLAFVDLYALPDPNVTLAVDHGLAAVFWLIVGAVVARVLRAFGRLAASML